MLERLGNRSDEELTELLEHGYVASGERRITKESAPEAPSPTYRLWDSWAKRKYHTGATTVAALIYMEDISIEEWSWYPNEAVTE